MAELQVQGGELVLHLSGAEKAEAVHGHLRAPLPAMRGIEIIETPTSLADHGFKIGMRVPGLAEVAIVRDDGRKIFAAVHHDTPRGVRVLLEGTPYDEWIVGCANPEAVAAGLPVAGMSPVSATLILVIVLAVGLVIAWEVFCLHDLARADRVRYLPKWGWTLVCLFSIPWGGIIYMILGRDSFGRDG